MVGQRVRVLTHVFGHISFQLSSLDSQQRSNTRNGQVPGSAPTETPRTDPHVVFLETQRSGCSVHCIAVQRHRIEAGLRIPGLTFFHGTRLHSLWVVLLRALRAPPLFVLWITREHTAQVPAGEQGKSVKMRESVIYVATYLYENPELTAHRLACKTSG